MASTSKRRKIEDENRSFKDDWTNEYFFILPNHNNAKPTCLICSDTISVNKANNLKRHYDSKHAGKYDKDFPKGSTIRSDKIKSLSLAYERSKMVLKRTMTEQEKCAEASLKISWILDQNMIPFSHSEIVKQCLIEAANTIFETKPEIAEQ
jgi:hypothetical protein